MTDNDESGKTEKVQAGGLLLDDIILSQVEGIGSLTYHRLVEHFGNSTAILNASKSELEVFDFLKPNTAARVVTARNVIDPTIITELCKRELIDIIPIYDERYPDQLKTLSDPPPLLYVRGELLPKDSFSIAVVGTRRISSYGERQTHRLSAAIAKAGFTIISGLAIGVDGHAHRAAINAGGRTVAVLGSGLLQVYPQEHIGLADQIVQSGGAIISEYAPMTRSTKWTFPQRNRIVCGLALGVVVIEAPLKSGAMISARLASEQGKDIFAVPGSIESELSKGCNQLIRDGAYLIDSVDDILDVLGPMRKPVSLFDCGKSIRHPNEVVLNEIEREVLKYVGETSSSLDSIVSATGLTVTQVLAALCSLEDKRIIRQLNPISVARV
ncbi:MAG: DNA-processing protein DprA [Planctomycetaceae bacterium]|jgi:DNA processing protein|nr:DNA-processing protein DprA [Planctomycetaceae bacterium]